MGALAPNIGPAGTGGSAAQNRAFFSQGQLAGRVRGHAELGSLFVAGVGGQSVLDGPAAHAGAVGLETQAAVKFAGGGAIGGGRLGGQQLGEQGGDWGGPVRMVIAAGTTRRPGIGLPVGASVEVVAVEFVEVSPPQAQFGGGRACRQLLGAMLGQEVTNEGSRKAMNQLFFMAAKSSRKVDFSLY